MVHNLGGRGLFYYKFQFTLGILKIEISAENIYQLKEKFIF